MRALQAICIVGAIAFTGMIHAQTPSVTEPDAMQTAEVSAETPTSPALSAAVPEATAAPETAPPVASGPLVTAKAEIGDDPDETKSVDLGQHGAARPVPATRDAPNDAANAARVPQDFRYLIYYVWSELPPAEKPAETVLRSLKNTPVGTPVEEIKRASDAFGLDFNFMKAVAKIEFWFRSQATHRLVCRPVPTQQIRVQ